MADKVQLKMHIVNYAKTRDVYSEYKRARNKEAFLKLHHEEIAKHEAAKPPFDALGGEKIPKVAELSQEYSALLAEKRSAMKNTKLPEKRCWSMEQQSRTWIRFWDWSSQ